MNFGEKLTKLLNEKQMTQRELAELTGVNVVSMSRYVHGTRTPRARVVVKMAKVLGADKVATGHYANVEQENGKFYLKKALDQNSAQSLKMRISILVFFIYHSSYFLLIFFRDAL